MKQEFRHHLMKKGQGIPTSGAKGNSERKGAKW